MNIDFKQLKKIAATCRKLGIKHFKSQEFEFTLQEVAPIATRQRKKRTNSEAAPTNTSLLKEIQELDQLTEDQLLFYSSGQLNESGAVNEN